MDRIQIGLALGGALALAAVAVVAVRARPGMGAGVPDAMPLDAATDALDAADASDAEADADAEDADDAEASIEVPTDETPLCRAFVEKERARIQAAASEGAEADADLSGAQRFYDVVTCHATPNGAWASTFGALSLHIEPEHGSDGSGDLELVHLAPDGGSVTPGGDEWRPRIARPWHGPMVNATIEVLGDYDGDGEPEVLVTEEALPYEGPGAETRAVYTFTHDAVERYAPADAFKIVSMEDIDGDGKKDIWFSLANVSLHSTCLGDYTFDAFLWPALATKSGAFDATSARARKVVDDACASAARHVVIPKDRPPELKEIAKAIVCGRVHGRAPSAIQAEVTKGCTDYTSILSLCTEPTPPRTCPSWFQTLPEVELPGSRPRDAEADAPTDAPHDARTTDAAHD